ncbi:MAG: histidine triad nucleotide-binding protein [Gemmatimonadaceae bacterium]
MPNDCVFCRIVRGDIPAAIVAENHSAIAFRDLDPQAPVHVLVVPREHISSLFDAGDSVVLGDVMRLAKEVARREGISQSGYRTVINTGPDGGQTVDHLHAHVLGGRQMAWPPG